MTHASRKGRLLISFHDATELGVSWSGANSSSRRSRDSASLRMPWRQLRMTTATVSDPAVTLENVHTVVALSNFQSSWNDRTSSGDVQRKLFRMHLSCFDECGEHVLFFDTAFLPLLDLLIGHLQYRRCRGWYKSPQHRIGHHQPMQPRHLSQLHGILRSAEIF